MKRLYLSGPMTGLPGLNFPAFRAEADRLRSLGYDVVNPAEINPDPGASWHQCMRRDLAALLTCDAIALLDGWQGSAGAHLEMHVAHRVGMQIVVAREIVWEVVAAPADALDDAEDQAAPDGDFCGEAQRQSGGALSR